MPAAAVRTTEEPPPPNGALEAPSIGATMRFVTRLAVWLSGLASGDGLLLRLLEGDGIMRHISAVIARAYHKEKVPFYITILPLSFERRIERSRQKEIDPRITVQNFPIQQQTDFIDRELRVVPLSQALSTPEIVQHLGLYGFEPADLADDALHFAERYPDEQLERNILIIGQRLVDPDSESTCIACLGVNARGEPTLTLEKEDGEWVGDCAVLARVLPKP